MSSLTLIQARISVPRPSRSSRPWQLHPEKALHHFQSQMGFPGQAPGPREKTQPHPGGAHTPVLGEQAVTLIKHLLSA